MKAFAIAFDLPLVCWRLEVDARDLTRLEQEKHAELYDAERASPLRLLPRLLCVRRARVHITDNIRSTLRLVNGSPVLYHSLKTRACSDARGSGV